jgi:hypothetical protein
MGVEIKGHDPKRLSPKGDKICVSLNENFFSDLLSSCELSQRLSAERSDLLI